ncbi:hypothetical protein J4216_06090 [Candidatus Woesearchaeota archaeon]|nr:hypothetical protein [Candidatus Woesearchaeota archaeon]
MVSEKQRQDAKEKAVLIALKHGMALIREDLEIYGMKIDGSKKFICKGSDYDHLWQEALKALKK